MSAEPAPSQDWMDLTATLTRKAVEVLADRLHEVNEGEITPQTGVKCLRSVYDAVSGFLPRDITELFWKAITELEQ